MPSGNIQRNIQTFFSTVINNPENSISNAPVESSNSRGTIRTSTTSRRTISNGSWIINDIHSAQQQQQLQQQQQQIQNALSTTLDPAFIETSNFHLHPRQSGAADIEFDIRGSILQSQILSPRNIQLASTRQIQSQSSELLEGYLTSDNDFDASVSPNIRNNVHFDVSELNQAGISFQQLQNIFSGSSPASLHNNLGARHHPQPPSNNALRNKIVYKLNCTYCKIPVCDRAMRAILLADTKIELYSTDIPPKAVVTMDDDRMTSGCNCRIRDTVCSGCGNVLGYHVSQPCDRCLDARNNGHFWMFCSEGVTPCERLHLDGKAPLYWASLTPMCEFVPASGYVAPGQAVNSNYESFCR